MNFDTQFSEHVLIITPLTKRLDASVTMKFKDAVLSHIHQGQTTLLLNFNHVDFIDSSCLGALVSLLKSINGKGALSLCELNNNIQGMFKLTRMDQIFKIYPDQPSALQYLHSSVAQSNS